MTETQTDLSHYNAELTDTVLPWCPENLHDERRREYAVDFADDLLRSAVVRNMIADAQAAAWDRGRGDGWNDAEAIKYGQGYGDGREYGKSEMAGVVAAVAHRLIREGDKATANRSYPQGVALRQAAHEILAAIGDHLGSRS